AVRAYISDAQHHIGWKLALHVEAPLLHIWIVIAFEKGAKTGSQELVVGRLHQTKRRQIQIGRSLAEDECRPLAGVVGALVPVSEIVGIGRSTYGAILIAEGR